ncbi:MAG: hypothetical protein DMD56_01480 [Gemmatimonadetes bacterium]|nr:MAG: hypothetical protein DMD56_01480 [Gemmatimonadota bacterium]
MPPANRALEGKAAVITGAGSGIGRASALRFAQQGARLVLTDVHDAEADAVVRAIAQAGGTACFVHADVSRRADNERMAATHSSLPRPAVNVRPWPSRPSALSVRRMAYAAE